MFQLALREDDDAASPCQARRAASAASSEASRRECCVLLAGLRVPPTSAIKHVAHAPDQLPQAVDRGAPKIPQIRPQAPGGCSQTTALSAKCLLLEENPVKPGALWEMLSQVAP